MELLEPKFRSQITERTVEYAFVLEHLGQLHGRDVLDIGVGPNPSLWYMLNTMGYNCTGTDLKRRSINYKFRIDDITNTSIEILQFDAVFCISTLEHIKDYVKAVENIAMLTKKGGLVILTFPFSQEYIPNAVEGHYTQSFSWREIQGLIDCIGALVSYRLWQCWSGKQWRDGQRLPFPIKRTVQSSSETYDDEKNADLIALAIRKE